MSGLITQEKKNAFIKLDQTLRDCHAEITEAEQSGNQMLKCLATAEATQALRTLLTDEMMRSVMRLMNSPLGFRTDRDGKTRNKNGDVIPVYTVAQVRDPLIVGMLKGFRPVGNEMNIIANNFYATKEGMERVIGEYPGLTDLRLTPGVPHMSGGGALVEYLASWKLQGKADSLACAAPTKEAPGDTRLAIRVNAGMGIDAILGKAKAKMLKRIFELVTGSEQTLDEEAADPCEVDVDKIEHSPEKAIDAEQKGETKEASPPAKDEVSQGPEPADTAPSYQDLYSTYQQQLAACRTNGAVHTLYRQWFGPESEIQWPSEAIQSAIEAKSFRNNEISKKK